MPLQGIEQRETIYIELSLFCSCVTMTQATQLCLSRMLDFLTCMVV